MLEGKPHWQTMVYTFVVQLAKLNLPAVSRVFKSQPLGREGLAICIVLLSAVFCAVEQEKGFKRRLTKSAAGRANACVIPNRFTRAGGITDLKSSTAGIPV